MLMQLHLNIVRQRLKRVRRRFVAALIATSVFSGLAASATAKTVWPGGAKAAVILTYDDALDSQLNHVVPVLDAAGFKATFFLSNVQLKDVPRWRRVAGEGHELGNHTVFHACSKANFAADPRYTTEAYTPASMLKEIEQENVLLTAIDGHARHGFATPCGDAKAGGQDYLEALRQANLVTYVRGVVTTPADLSANVATIDLMHVPSRGFGEGTTIAQLTDLVSQAEAGRGWAVFLFHGVGGDYLQVTDETHRAFIAWLSAHRKEVWVTTLQQAIDWAKQHPGS
jgi:peptidoglycan/xylan/chitin deacetylase (PgdA/CDA1 family)